MRAAMLRATSLWSRRPGAPAARHGRRHAQSQIGALQRRGRVPERPRSASGLRCRALAADEKAAMRDIMESASMVDEMVNEIGKEMLLSASVAYVTGEDEEAELQQLVRAAVARRLDAMNNAFIPVLASYAEGAMQEGQPEIAELLVAIHDEVLASVARRLPPEMQLLNFVLQMADGAERKELVAQQTAPTAAAGGEAAGAAAAAGDGGEDALPRCPLDDLERAVTQLVDDMEAQDEIPDRQLLARMCLVREEIWDLMRERAFVGAKSNGGGGAPAAAAAEQPRGHPRYKDPLYQEAEVTEVAAPAAAAAEEGSAGAAPQQARRKGRPAAAAVPSGTGFGAKGAAAARQGRRGKQQQLQQQGGAAAQEVEVEVLQEDRDSDEEEEWGAAKPAAAAAAEPAPEPVAPGAAAAADCSEQGEGEEGAGGSGGTAAVAEPWLPFVNLGAVPRSSINFLKELVGVQSSERRRALLEKAFREDWEGVAPGARGEGSASGSGPGGSGGPDAAFYEEQRRLLARLAAKGKPGAAPPGEESVEDEALEVGEGGEAQLAGGRYRPEGFSPEDWVRPGRFMQGLTAVQSELLQQAAAAASAAGGGGQEKGPWEEIEEGPGAGGVSDLVLERVEEIRREALVVLMDIASDEGAEYSP